MKLDWQPIELNLAEPFVGSRGTVKSVRQILVSVSVGQDAGLGTSPLPLESGMVLENTHASLETCARIIRGAPSLGIEHVIRALEEHPLCSTHCIAAIDLALHDLLGRRAGFPLWRLWGLSGLKIVPTALSLGQRAEHDLLARAAKLQNWPILKIKMSSTSDVALTLRLRAAYPGRLWVDGNGSWDFDRALEAAAVFAEAGVELLEQPMPRASPRLRELHCRSPVPIIADEDCEGPNDVLRLAGCVYGVNLKLVKCGGLLRTLEAARLARRVGLRVMLGCKTESALGVTAIAHLAGLADYLDLDGHLDLVDDPFEGLAINIGAVTLPDQPGLGAAVRRGIVTIQGLSGAVFS